MFGLIGPQMIVVSHVCSAHMWSFLIRVFLSVLDPVDFQPTFLHVLILSHGFILHGVIGSFYIRMRRIMLHLAKFASNSSGAIRINRFVIFWRVVGKPSRLHVVRSDIPDLLVWA